jgi:segregation and condensation protein A
VPGSTTVARPLDNLGAVPYEVRTEVFEGPFDLLLHLVLRSQVDVYEVSLSSIVDAFVAELGRMQELDLDVATEFLLVAATLIELKTRGLLPGSDETDLDEELAIWEERDLLLSRLLACKTFKDASTALARLAAQAERSVPRRGTIEEAFSGLTPDVLAGVTPAQLRDAFLRAAAPKPSPRVDLDHVAPIRVSVADAVDELLDELPRVGRITFRRLTQDLVARLDVIVRFLALLELYKQGAVEIVQHGTFGSIEIEWLGTGADMSTGLVDAYDG